MPKIDITIASDMALVELARSGISDAYAELWKRHAPNLTVAIRCFTGFDPDDIAQETFMRILLQIQAGKGPQTAFRAYAIMTARNIATNMSRSRTETEVTGIEDDAFEQLSVETTDLGDDVLEKSFTYQVFNSLPTRWQEVLWYREVEDLPVKAFCTFLGMSENSTSALLLRAREGFKQAWIAANLEPQANLSGECKWVVERLPQLTRGKATSSTKKKLNAHLVNCTRCSILSEQAEEVHSRLALVLLPGVMGGVGAQQYVAWLQSGAVAPVASEAFAASLSTHMPVPQPPESLVKVGTIRTLTAPVAVISAGALAASVAVSLAVGPISTPPPARPTGATSQTQPEHPGGESSFQETETAENQGDRSDGDSPPATEQPGPDSEVAATPPASKGEPSPQTPSSPPAIIAPSALSALPADGIEVGVFPRLAGTGAPNARIELTITNERGETYSHSVVADGQGRWVYTPASLMGTITVTGIQTYSLDGVEIIDPAATIGTFQIGRGLGISVEQTTPQQTTIRVTGLHTPTKNQVVNIESTVFGTLAAKQPESAPGEYAVTVPYARSELGDLRYWQGDTSLGPQRVWWRSLS